MTEYLPLILATFLLAGLVKGVVGLGLPTIAVGLLGLLMAPLQAAALLIIPSMVSNIWQLCDGRRPLPMLRRTWMMQYLASHSSVPSGSSAQHISSMWSFTFSTMRRLRSA